MCEALFLHKPCLVPCHTWTCAGGSCLALLLSQEGVSHVLQGQADRGLRQGALPSADGTLAPGLLLVPELLQACPAEAVAALEHNGVLEDLTADRTRQLLFQHGA